jgi:acyl-CoA reductase-like NAD-dependent aldehyde dehydrogenase
MLHIPVLRHGVPYKSLEMARVAHHRTKSAIAEVSQANAGLIRRDLLPEQQAASRASLDAMPVQRLLDISREAADHFLHGSLPIGDDRQTQQDYIEQVSATTGMPFVLVRRNMDKISAALSEMPRVLEGLTRGLDLTVLDTGANARLSFYPRAQALGVVLPNNSPGVHALWTPAIALKTPLVLKPGSAEPWTPYRIAQAFIAAGCPREAFSYYPCDHAGAGEIVRRCGRSMFFGDVSAVGAFAGDPRIELHGPGYSKVLIGQDQIDRWPELVDVMVRSIADNGGRSCVNASGVWVPGRGREIAEALAERLARIEPLPADHPDALLAPFLERRVAEWIDEQIEGGLQEPGAIDLTAAVRQTPRLVEVDGSPYLLPTVIYCDRGSYGRDRPEGRRLHGLANREFLFPFVSVVEISADEMAAVPASLGPTLVLSAITRDESLVRRLVSASSIERLNIGPIATNQIAWDQPHEGNLFDLLYARRSFQSAALSA